MGKHKAFIKTDLGIPQVEHSRDELDSVVIQPEVISKVNTEIEFERNPSQARTFNFARWYGAGIDPITYACQRQIERFLAGQDGAITTATVIAYCRCGLRHFLDYCMLRAKAFGRDLVLADVDRDLIDGYLGYLAGKGLKSNGQKSTYTHTKPVLLTLGKRGLLPLITYGDAATFPRNPFPNSNRKAKGETALSSRERKKLVLTLWQAISPIWSNDASLTGNLLVLALLTVALHTGRNTTPLLEMSRDCLHPHPKDNTAFLVLWKRRGYNISKVGLRAEPEGERLLEFTIGVKTNVERLIRRVIELTEPLNIEAPNDLKDRVWLFRSRAHKSLGQVTAVTPETIANATRLFVAEYGLTASDGKSLRINVSRLRKTFADRIFELTGGNLATTAAALGNTPQVAEQNYLRPDENARRNWKFMGEVLVEELQSRTIGATYKDTPVGLCADPINGQYAPKREGATCMNFLNCLRCKHYAVTAEDLYKLFSFYFRVLAERSRMDKRRWAREYAHIPRLIDHYIVAEGLRRGTFKVASVEAARELARTHLHPFWSVDLIESLEVFA